MGRTKIQQARLDALQPLIRSWASQAPPLTMSTADFPSEPDRPFPHFPGGDDHGGSSSDADTTLALLLPLLILLSTLLFLLLLFLVFLVVVRRRGGRGAGILHALGGGGGIRLGENEGPIDLSRDDESWAEGEGGLEGMERRWLEQTDEGGKIGYMRSKVWQMQYPPNSQPTDITLSQFLSIQEKGVSAWSFEPDYDSNPSLPVYVQSRTEITFLADGAGMASEEGGGVCVQSNLPLPKLNEVYYWECKMYEKPEGTNVAIGLATKPYPSFRLPGWNRLSIGYFSSDGFKCHNYPFTGTSYGPSLKEGDVLGVGYRPRTGCVFFTRNGRKLEDAYVGLNRYNVFPTVGADGAAMVHVNLGQAGFVFIEANVKKWGLAPMAGTLAPPPAYGHQMGSILLAAADGSPAELQDDEADRRRQRRRGEDGAPRIPAASADRAAEDVLPSTSSSSAPATTAPTTGSSSRRRPSGRAGADVRPTRVVPGVAGSAAPVVPSPLRSSEGAVEEEESDEISDGGSDESDMPHNPPTPRPLDISLEEFVRNEDLASDDETTSSQVRRHLRESRRRRRQQSEQSSRSHRRRRRPDDDDDRPGMSRPVSYETATSSVGSSTVGAGGQSPPTYSAIDPHKYAPGVAEAILGDHFPGLGNSPAPHNSASSPGFAPSSRGSSLNHLRGESSSSWGASGYERGAHPPGEGSISTLGAGWRGLFSWSGQQQQQGGGRADAAARRV